MDGQIVFFAPGETVKLTDKVSFVVKTGMDEGELSAILGAAILSNFDTDSADGADDSVKRPIGFYIVFIGIPILLIVFISYRIFGPARRRGALPSDERH